jgi:hypothetical protein
MTFSAGQQSFFSLLSSGDLRWLLHFRHALGVLSNPWPDTQAENILPGMENYSC